MKKTLAIPAIILFSISILQTFLIAQERPRITVIPKNRASQFWKTVHAGAKFGAMGSAEIIWKAPQNAGDKNQQIAFMQQCLSDGTSGIVLSPIDSEALVEPVAIAMKRKIPVLIFDSALKGAPGKDFVCFVGIDNKKAGAMAGDHLARSIEGRGKVMLLRYMKGQSNTTDREEGFLEALLRYPGIRVSAKDRYAGATVEEAKRTSMNLLAEIKDADGIFCPNEASTMGMLLALQETKLAGKIKFIGFDTPPAFIDALNKNEINALIVQNPSLIGFLSVKTLLDKIHGKKIPQTLDTGVHLIIRRDLDDPDVKKIIAMPAIDDNS